MKYLITKQTPEGEIYIVKKESNDELINHLQSAFHFTDQKILSVILIEEKYEK